MSIQQANSQRLLAVNFFIAKIMLYGTNPKAQTRPSMPLWSSMPSITYSIDCLMIGWKASHRAGYKSATLSKSWCLYSLYQLRIIDSKWQSNFAHPHIGHHIYGRKHKWQIYEQASNTKTRKYLGRLHPPNENNYSTEKSRLETKARLRGRRRREHKGRFANGHRAITWIRLANGAVNATPIGSLGTVHEDQKRGLRNHCYASIFYLCINNRSN